MKPQDGARLRIDANLSNSPNNNWSRHLNCVSIQIIDVSEAIRLAEQRNLMLSKPEQPDTQMRTLSISITEEPILSLLRTSSVCALGASH